MASEQQKCPSKTFCNLVKPAIYEGAGSRIRTDDLLITNQLLYQLSYAGTDAAHITAPRRRKQAVDSLRRG